MKKRILFSLTALVMATVMVLGTACSSGNASDGSKESPASSKNTSESLSEAVSSESSKAVSPSSNTSEIHTSSSATENSSPVVSSSPASETSSPNGSSPSEDPNVPVTGISLDVTKLRLLIGDSYHLTVTVKPEDATDKQVSFKSSNTRVATVDKSGNVKAVSLGKATVTVSSADRKFIATCEVEVADDHVAVESVSLGQTSVTLIKDQSFKLNPTVLPEDASDKTLNYTVENDSILSVSEDGTVTALNDGCTYITAVSGDGKAKAYCIVTVASSEIPVTAISFDKATVEIAPGTSMILNISYTPSNTTDRTATWESDAPEIVKVESGKILALKEGTANITATVGGKTAVCKITVSKSASDPIDAIALDNATLIENDGGYASGLRVKTSLELLFSPNLEALRRLVSAGASYSDFVGYLRFTYLPSTPDGSEYTYRSVTVEPQQSKGDWVDFFLQGDGIDCGFCPTAGEKYRIDLVLVKKSQPTKAVMYGTYTFTAAETMATSPYYHPTEIGGQVIRTEGQYYITYESASNGSIFGDTKQLLSENAPGNAVVAIPNDGFTFVMWSDGVKTPIRFGDVIEKDTKVTAYFTVNTGESLIPAINIYTDSGYPVASKTYETATLVVTGAEKDKYNISASIRIRFRGNSSLNAGAAQSNYDSKNSYRLSFDEKVKLLGIGDSKNKDWVLNSNKFDVSQLRNYLVWTFANKMGTIPYVPECRWVQLYINGEYRGMYMVTELIEVANDRIAINDQTTDADVGFLIEADFRGNYDNDPYFYLDNYGPLPSQNLHGAVEFCIKSHVADEEQLAFIKRYMNDVNTAFAYADREAIESLVDMASFVDMYIIEELSKDCDVGRASFFMQRDVGGKLYFTAPWDFDFGFGTYGTAINTYSLVSKGGDGCPWYGMLLEEDWFREMVLDRMKELTDAFNETLDEVRAKGEELTADADKSNYFWQVYNRHYHQYVSGQASSALGSYQDHIDFLIDWASERYEYLAIEIEDY